MRRHVQVEGVRRWAGEHIIDLQAEPFKVIDAFFEEFGNCILKGCKVSGTEEGKYNIASGVVALSGADPEGNTTFKVAPFAGAEGVALPAYFVLNFEVVEREYVDEKMHPVYYEYGVEIVTEKPENRAFLEIGTDGARRFLDVTGVTHKLDKDGDGKDVVVSFAEAGERENVQTGETLSVLWGKVRKWFSSLKAVAFSGKTADLEDDAEHRLTTDTEKARWNDTYTKKETDDKDTAVQNAVDNLAGDVYRKAETESRDAEVLKSAKEYTDGKVTDLGGDTYRKSETYNRTEVDTKDSTTLKTAKEYADNQVSGLGNQVYRKTETYNRGEIDSKDSATLEAAKKYAADRIAEIVGSSPDALDTLYEIAAALGNDPNFATTIMALINGKADAGHKHTKAQITDFPTSMPASDVYAWAKASTKPTYSHAEVGAAAANHNHDSVYQPKGSYAAASHKHAATDVNEDSTHRFMTDAERSKLNGVETGANKYVHPSTHSADMISDSATKVMMTAAERTKLNGIETGANNYVHPNNSSTRHVTDAEKAKWNGMASVQMNTSTNGYAKIGGLIIQWGYLTLQGNSSRTINFPIAFANNCLNVQLTIADNTESDYIAFVNAKSRTSVTIYQYGKGSKNCYWLAIGY